MTTQQAQRLATRPELIVSTTTAQDVYDTLHEAALLALATDFRNAYRALRGIDVARIIGS